MLIKSGDIISQSVKLYKKNWVLFIKYAALLLAPSLIFSLLKIFFPPTINLQEMVVVFNNKLIFLIITFLIAEVIRLWISISFIKTIVARYEQQKEDGGIGKEILKSTKLLIPIILVDLLVVLIVVGGLLLLIIPGLIFSIWYLFARYAIIIDNKRIKESLKVSRALVQGRWWGVLWRIVSPIIVFGLITSIMVWIARILFVIILSRPETTVGFVVLTIFIFLVVMVFVPLIAAVPSILYVELKKTPIPKEEEMTLEA